MYTKYHPYKTNLNEINDTTCLKLLKIKKITFDILSNYLLKRTRYQRTFLDPFIFSISIRKRIRVDELKSKPKKKNWRLDWFEGQQILR